MSVLCFSSRWKIEESKMAILFSRFSILDLLISDPHGIHGVLHGADDRQRRELAGFWILTWDIFKVHVQAAEFAFDLDIVAITRETWHSQNAHARLIGADAGQADRTRHVDVGRKAAAGFAC